MEKKIALLIDAENTSSKYIDTIMEEVKQYGDVTFQRMYGDFSSSKMVDWTKKALDFAIVPIHQSIYTTGKNAADIMLVIDAMDIMFQNNVDGFCIVSSDSDFTRLANRLRESGKMVIGMGMTSASKTFISACNEYKFLDKLFEDFENEESDDSFKSAMTPISEIKKAINRIVQEAESKGELANLGSAKSTIQRQFPDFDERNYGYTLFRKLVEEETKFKLKQNGSTVNIVRVVKKQDEDILHKSIYNLLSRNKSKNIGQLKKELIQAVNINIDSKIKGEGYNKFSTYLKNLDGVIVVDNNSVKLSD